MLDIAIRSTLSYFLNDQVRDKRAENQTREKYAPDSAPSDQIRSHRSLFCGILQRGRGHSSRRRQSRVDAFIHEEFSDVLKRELRQRDQRTLDHGTTGEAASA
jgi:hypothetical protein